MESIRLNFERAWRGVIAPSKFHYNMNSICPKQQTINNKTIERIDFNVKNDEGKNISAMILKQKFSNPTQTILYLHGNGGNKVEALSLISMIGKYNIAVISFDFIGCGNSDLGYLTYGYKQSSDAELVLREAYKYICVSKLIVWGRSMGAVTAILFAERNHIIHKLVLDSPFINLEHVIARVIKKETNLPELLLKVILYFLKKQIERKLNYSLFSQDYLVRFKKVPREVSILLICSHNDDIVPRSEVEKFYKINKSRRQLLEIQESHEEDRSLPVIQEILKWIKKDSLKKNAKLKIYRPIEAQIEQVHTIC